MRVLVDTNIVSYGMKRQAEFFEPIRYEFARLPTSAELAISVVTLQEFGLWALFEGNWADVRADLLDTYRHLLPFDHASAEAALRFDHLTRPELPQKPRSLRKDAIGRWNHDTAIVGTAQAHGVDRIITAERQWREYRPHFDGEIVIVEPENA